MSIIIPNNLNNVSDTSPLGHSHVGWLNEVTASTVSSLSDPDNLGYLHDNMTSLYWIAGSGTVDIDINLSAAKLINWVGIANGNWFDASTIVEIYVDTPANKVAEITGLPNGAPMMFVFDEISTTFIRIRFISTSELRVGEVGTGYTLKFPCLPNIGLMLAKFNNKDKILNKITDGALFAGSSVIDRSRATKGQFDFVPIDWVRQFWLPFSNNYRGKLVWFAWDTEDYNRDISFGHWDAQDLSYTRSTFTRIDFSVNGDYQ